MVDFTTVLLAKKETVYGTDAVPTVAANGILTRNFAPGVVETDRLERNLDSRTFGATPDAPSNERQSISYEVELAGSGTAGTAPAWMELLEGCGMAAPVLAAGVDAQQRMALPTALASALTQYHWVGDQRRKMVGARGTFSIDFTAGAYPYIALSMTGLLPAVPFDSSIPAAVDLTRWKQPVEINTANTDFLLDGYAAPLRSLRLDANVNTNLRNLVGSRYVNRGNHAVSGQVVVEAPALVDKDYIARLRSGATVAMELVQGTVAGNIIELDMPNVQITSIAESNEDDRLMWTMGVRVNIAAGQDDLIITAR